MGSRRSYLILAFGASSSRVAERKLLRVDACSPSEVLLLGKVGDQVLLEAKSAPGTSRETLRSAGTGHCDQGTQPVYELCQTLLVTGSNACGRNTEVLNVKGTVTNPTVTEQLVGLPQFPSEIPGFEPLAG